MPRVCVLFGLIMLVIATPGLAVAQGAPTMDLPALPGFGNSFFSEGSCSGMNVWAMAELTKRYYFREDEIRIGNSVDEQGIAPWHRLTNHACLIRNG